MLKKIALILTAFTYLMLSVGVGIAMHYCGDEMTSVGLYATDGCGCGDESADSDCCEDDYIFFKTDNDQKPELRVDTKNLKSDANPAERHFLTDSNVIKPQEEKAVGYKNPPSLARSLFLLNHSFIFYG